MKRILSVLAVFMAISMTADLAAAKGGASSGGRASAGRSSSSISSGSKGGFSSSSVSRPSTPSAAPARSTTTTTTYSSTYVRSSGGYYGGWGPGYHYDNGFMTGLIIGNMMHPTNTVMYVGPGTYANNAVLYPDGRVVNQQGYVVGTYVNGVFTPVQNGPMVAQQVPQDAGARPVDNGMSFGEIVGAVVLVLACIALIFVLIGILA